MSPDQKQIVQSTWEQVVPMADAAADMFYDRLFKIDTTTRKLFKATDMADQRKKLVRVMSSAIRGLDNIDALASSLEDLGRRHVGYGVTDEHYDSVGVALMWTLEQGLGRAWTPTVASAWADAYALLSGVMRRAARDSVAQTYAVATAC
jgi:hemoglobin-like flavoprotein